MKLFCKGKILDAFKAAPSRVAFNQISRSGPPITQTVTITRGDAGPLNLKLNPMTEKGITTELREITAGEKYELDVIATPPFDKDRVFANISLETGVAESPTATIGVTLTVRPRIVVQPNRFTVPQAPGPEWEQSVRLVWDDEAVHKILSATVGQPGLTVEVREADGGQEVVLHASEDYRPRSGIPSVIVKTDDPQMQAVQVAIASVNPKSPRRSNPKFSRSARPAPKPPVTDQAKTPAASPVEAGEPPAPEKQPPAGGDSPR